MATIQRRALLASWFVPAALAAGEGYAGEWPNGGQIALYSGRAQKTYFIFQTQGFLRIGYFDHRSGTLPQPVLLGESGAGLGLRMDAEGFLEVAFSGKCLRSRKPYSIEGFVGGEVFEPLSNDASEVNLGFEVMDRLRLLSGEEVLLGGRGQAVFLARRPAALHTGIWKVERAFERSSNGGAGKLFVEGNTWRVLVPAGPIELWESRDQGRLWRKIRDLGPLGASAVLQPVSYHADLIALWSAGDALFYTNRDAIRVYRLPARMSGENLRPERLPLSTTR